MRVSAACLVALVPDVDASALSPHVASSFKRFFEASSPPDKEKGSDAAGRHPASPLVKASAVNAIIRGMGVREEGQMLFLGGMGVCVSVCVRERASEALLAPFVVLLPV